jgi:hypothetical protein
MLSIIKCCSGYYSDKYHFMAKVDFEHKLLMISRVILSVSN